MEKNGLNKENKTFTIYVYTTPRWKEHQGKRGSKKGKGLFKIGNTGSTDVKQYLERSMMTGPFSEFNLKLIHSVPLSNDYQPLYKATDIYKILEEKNINRLKGEGFECTIKEIENAIIECQTKKQREEKIRDSYKLSKNQKDAIKQAIANFEKEDGKFKYVGHVKKPLDGIFTTYKLIEKQQGNNVLIITTNSLNEDLGFNSLKKYNDFNGWGFQGMKYKKKRTNKKMPTIYFQLFDDVILTFIDRMKNKRKKETLKRIMDETIGNCVFYEIYNEDALYKIAADIYHKEKFYAKGDRYLGDEPGGIVFKSLLKYVQYELFLTISPLNKGDNVKYSNI